MKRILSVLLILCIGILSSATALAGNAQPEIIAPEAYTQNGTLPIYRAIEQDFTKDFIPELFNQSGIASREKWGVLFKDEAQLQLSPGALYYSEYSGTFDANNNQEEQDAGPAISPLAALSGEIYNLAGTALEGWPGTDEVYKLDKTALTHITLDEAKATLEALLAKLNVNGYVCDNALDMSLERIVALGNDKNAMIASGEYFTNVPPYVFTKAPAEDEGYFLSYHKPGSSDEGQGYLFRVYAYVTSRGVVKANISDMYIPGEVYFTPEKLVTPEAVMEKLPEEIAASQFPDMKVASISSLCLTYAPMRAANKADGMVLSPIWRVVYQDAQAAAGGYDCWAEFDAVDGKLLEATFK
jgi:hypothetical protein